LLSYQHGYHAGNAADVHKHLALVLLLDSLKRKDKPFCFIDAHAGRGRYDLEGEQARKTGEAANGVLKLAAAAGLPRPVRALLDLVARCNSPGTLRYYPGTPLLAQMLLREHDRAVLLELHPQEVAALKLTVGNDRRISIHARDCHEGLPALLPPAERRGLVLLDPSYEVKNEYESVVDLLERSLARWASGIYVLWFPLLPDERHQRLLRRLRQLALPKTLVSEFLFARAAVGLQGSGIVVVNYPWQFDDELAAAMPAVVTALAGSAAGEHRLRGIEPG